MPDYILRVYGDDDETLQIEFGTRAAHPNPYLCWPSAFGDSQVNFLKGSAVLGTVSLDLVDWPASPGDQDSGIVTAALALAPGGPAPAGESAWNGRRMLFALENVGGDPIPVLDGVCSGTELNSDWSSYRVTLRDVRERERRARLFEAGGTSVVWPRGVLYGYGRYVDSTGAEGWLVPPTKGVRGVVTLTLPALGLVSSDPAAQVFVDFTGNWISGTWRNPFGSVPADLIVTDRMKSVLLNTAEISLLRPWAISLPGGWMPASQIVPSSVPVMTKVAAAWREVGETEWHFVVGLNALHVAITRPAQYKPADGGEKINVTAMSHAQLWPAARVDSAGLPLPVDELPPVGATIEFAFVYVGAPTSDYPLHLEAPAWKVAKDVYDAGRVRYDLAALQAVLREPVLARITKPVDNARDWLERKIFAPLGAVPALDTQGRVSPVRYRLPATGDTIFAITDANSTLSPDWGHPSSGAINYVEVKYSRDYLAPASDDPLGTAAGGDGILTRTVEVYDEDVRSVSLMDKQTLTVDMELFRAVGGTNGAPLTGDARDDTAHQLARERTAEAKDRFLYGGQARTATILLSEFPGMRVGSWAFDQRRGFPDYQTRRRSGGTEVRLVQVTAMTRLNPMEARVRLEDAGAANQPCPSPTLTGSLVNADNTVRLTVAGVTPGVAARIDYAIDREAVPTAPPADSTAWVFAVRGAAGVNGYLVTPPLPADVRVWFRIRGEAPGRISSPWLVPMYLQTTLRPALGALAVETDDEAGAVTVRWPGAQRTGGVRIRYGTALAGPGAIPLAVTVDASGAPGSFVLPGLVLPSGWEILVDVEPWTGFAAGAVTGTAGARVPAHDRRGTRDGVLVDPKVSYNAATARVTLTASAATPELWYRRREGGVWGDPVLVAVGADGRTGVFSTLASPLERIALEAWAINPDGTEGDIAPFDLDLLRGSATAEVATLALAEPSSGVLQVDVTLANATRWLAYQKAGGWPTLDGTSSGVPDPAWLAADKAPTETSYRTAVGTGVTIYVIAYALNGDGLAGPTKSQSRAMTGASEGSLVTPHASATGVLSSIGWTPSAGMPSGRYSLEITNDRTGATVDTVDPAVTFSVNDATEHTCGLPSCVWQTRTWTLVLTDTLGVFLPKTYNVGATGRFPDDSL